MAIKNKPNIKVEIEYLNQVYRIIKSYLMATEMLGHQLSQRDIQTYKYIKYRLVAFERINKRSKYYKSELESEELIL